MLIEMFNEFDITIATNLEERGEGEKGGLLDPGADSLFPQR